MASLTIRFRGKWLDFYPQGFDRQSEAEESAKDFLKVCRQIAANPEMVEHIFRLCSDCACELCKEV